MTEIIRMLREEGLLFPIQLVLLVIDGYLVVSNHSNSWVLLSAIFVISTLVLQAVRRRFLLLHPQNRFISRESPALDTTYLRIVIVLSTLLAFMGIALAFSDRNKLWWDVELTVWLPLLAITFVALVPFVFWRWSQPLNDSIANRLRDQGPFRSQPQALCPCCKKTRIQQTNEIMDSHTGHITLECNKCGYCDEWDVSLNIGE